MASVIQAGTASNTALTLSSDTSGELQLKTNNGSTTAMTLTTGGNVGIGTASPAQALHVVGRGIVDNGTGTQNGFSVGTTSTSTGTNFGTIDINGTSYSGLYLRVGNTNNGVFWANQGVQVELGSLTSIPLLLKTNDTERMRITSAGLVGIGENSPTHRLQVAGNSGAEVKITRGTNDCVISLSNNIGGAVFIGSTVASPLVLQTSNTERMRIDTSGNVGIGTSSPTAPLTIVNSALGEVFRLTSSSANIYGLASDGTISCYTGGVLTGIGGFVGTSSNHPYIFRTNNTERMRINSDGDLLVGQTAQNFATSTGVGILGNGRGLFACSGNSGVAVSRLSNTGALVDLFYGNTFIGAISTNGSTITYGGTSDYRLKDDIKPLTNALAKIALLKPCEFTWKNTGIEDNGFIAHELAEVCPNAVVGEKDAVNEDGSIKPQQIDTSFLVATLTAAIQEQQAMIEELKQEVAKLKGV